ncbi:MAG: NAD(P)-binding protein [Comamonadaceae bacterium]|nr:NAD(P)-binding protein [Comamonadaceae bacterium]
MAVIGAGPAGLACAFYLTRLGYKPVVFEALPVAGGMMKVGIPDYPPAQGQAARPRSLVIERAGVEIQPRTRRWRSIEDLHGGRLCQAVFVGSGAHQAQPLEHRRQRPARRPLAASTSCARSTWARRSMSATTWWWSAAARRPWTPRARPSAWAHATCAWSTAAPAPRCRPSSTRWSDAEEEGIEMDFLVNPAADRRERRQGQRHPHASRPSWATSTIPAGAGRCRSTGSEYTIRANLIISCLGQKLSLGLTGGKLNLDRRGHIAVDPQHHGHQRAGRVRRRRRRQPVHRHRRRGPGPQWRPSASTRYFGYDGRLLRPRTQAGGRWPTTRRPT